MLKKPTRAYLPVVEPPLRTPVGKKARAGGRGGEGEVNSGLPHGILLNRWGLLVASFVLTRNLTNFSEVLSMAPRLMEEGEDDLLPASGDRS